MRSIKPGRGPSLLSGIVGIFMVCFGIVFTILIATTAGFPFALFGIFWTCCAIAITVYNFKNGTSKNRYSTFDVVDGREEPDPLNERFGNKEQENDELQEKSFCPYCGRAVRENYEYCPDCGKKLP